MYFGLHRTKILQDKILNNFVNWLIHAEKIKFFMCAQISLFFNKNV